MVNFYVISTKKAVHKPFEAPYFITTEPSVASWFFDTNVVGNTGEKRIIMVDEMWNTNVFTPYAEFADQKNSPAFNMFPLYVFGEIAPLVLPDGTTYHNWFTPRFITPVFSEETVENAKAIGCNAYVETYANLWHEHHLFRTWKWLN